MGLTQRLIWGSLGKKTRGVIMRAKGVILGLLLFVLAFPKVATTADTTELRLGFYNDKEMLSARTFVFNDTLNKRINKIGNRVASVSGRPDIKYTFRVVNDPTINAYAAAGGFVYINTGLLDILESKDELAALLSHEIGHISEKHQINSIRSAHAKRVAGNVAGFAIGVGLGVAGAAAMGSGPSSVSPAYVYHQQLTSQVASLGLTTGRALGDTMTVSMIKGYERKQELKADALAIQYTKKAGYKPEALVNVFKRLISIRHRLEYNEKTYISSLINAKPGLEERLKQAENLISKAK